MSKYRVITDRTAEILNRPTVDVTVFDTSRSERLRAISNKLHRLVESEEALGVAAPQVGIAQSIIVVRVHGRFVPMINPRIIEYGDLVVTDYEGCLSLPGTFVEVQRYDSVMVIAQTNRGNTQTFDLDGLYARIAQHEIDHLHGILMTRYLTTGYDQP